MQDRRGVSLSFFKAVGLVVGVLLCPFVAYGIWLLVTPDYDGGRRAVGGLIVCGAAVVLLVLLAAYLAARRQSSA